MLPVDNGQAQPAVANTGSRSGGRFLPRDSSASPQDGQYATDGYVLYIA